ncbi:hypothetical protein NDU88_002562 [Pleurodeles waltl]|uniref:Uncharacterized protein n=1 Tax=Pleurodeles waltl TaxID=8319 RepID=A0AAV7NGR8_PLEWA|nr:hypothetical protein NDU88_002562 [Pleurodeles waltl]
MARDLVQEKRRVSNQRVSRARRATVSDLQVGDQVLLKQTLPGSKFRTPFSSVPWRIVQRNGSAVVAQRGSDTVTRNVLSFKRFHLSGDNREDVSCDTDDGGPLSLGPEV